MDMVNEMFVIKRRGKYLKSECWEWSADMNQDVGFWNNKERAEFHIAEYESRLKGAKVVTVKITVPKVIYQELA